MITADKKLLEKGSNAWERLQLQQGVTETLDVVYWGRGALTPALFTKGNYDVVTAQDPLWRGVVGWFLAKKLRTKLNIQVHMDLSALPFFKHMLATILLRQADSVRVVSERSKTQVVSLGVKAKISVLPVFVDLQKFGSVVRREHTGKHILWIGRFEDEKNPLLAVDVLREVLKVVPDARLQMLGEGSMHKRIREYAANLPVDSHLGWRNPSLFLDTADVVLCTSRFESWGASIAESLSAGVPVVAPDVGIAKEAGAIVVPKEDLAKATIDVLRRGARGSLKLPLLPADQWAVQWSHSLI